MSRLPAAIPFTTTFISTGRSGNAGGLGASAGSFSFKLQTVSGRDCTMKMFLGKGESRSIAHSMS